MPVHHFSLSLSAGDIPIELGADLADDGLSVLVTGGDRTHVGGVALSVPRASLTGVGESCDTWVIPVPGHKDSVIAEKAGERLCRALGVPVVVTVGIHVDDASSGQIADIEACCAKLTDGLIDWARKIS